MPHSKCVLSDFIDSMIRVRSEDELLSEMAWSLKSDFKSEACDIFLAIDPNTLMLRASTCTPELVGHLRLSSGIGVTGSAYSKREAVFVPRRFEKHPSHVPYPGMDDQPWESGVAIPMEYGGKLLGMCLSRKSTPWPFTAQLKARLIQIVNGASKSLVAYQTVHELGTQANRLGALSEVSKTIASSPYVEEILQLLVNLTAQQFNYKVCTVRLLDERNNELVLRATQAPAKAYQRKRAIKLGESIAGRAIDEKRPIIVSNVQTEDDYIGHDLAIEQGLQSMICIPLLIQDRTVGVLSCYTGECRDFTPDEIKALETLAKQTAVSIEHAKLQVRSTLMQEMHHRVKNNLQQVASLLRLQIRSKHQSTVEEALNNSLNRILAISAVHDLLSREDLDTVGIKSVAEALVSHQQHSFLLPDRRIRFEVRGDDFRLNMNQATQVALVLNELILNAIEHGFKTTLEGEVHVTVEEKGNEVSLWVSNNGDRLPVGFDISKDGHLGLQIVESLARSLGGRLSLVDKIGWSVAEVTFQRESGE
jgi:two-component sensor histidine kinase